MRANEEDFDGFYAAVFARLVGQLTLVTGNLHEAEEVVQEALARAVPRWARLRAYDVPEAWVRRVALNLATSHHRQARRRLAAALRDCRYPTARYWSCTTCSACQSRRWPASWPSRWAPSRPGWRAAAALWPAVSPNPSRRCQPWMTCSTTSRSWPTPTPTRPTHPARPPPAAAAAPAAG